MKIVVAGASDVGEHLAIILADEEMQDITMMDTNATRLEEISHGRDMLTFLGSPIDVRDLRNCGVEKADLFISVMPAETENLLACMLASRLGVEQTMARVDSARYLSTEYMHLFERMGISSLIYPEELAAEEINTIFQNPWARQYIELFGGSIVVIGVKVRFGAEIVGKKLSEIPTGKKKSFHVVAIRRGPETIIPTGETQIEHGDILFFTAIASDKEVIRQISGKKKVEVGRVVIIGAGTTALRTIAKAPRNIDFVLIEKDKNRINEVQNLLPSNVTLYHGDGRNTDLLNEVGLSYAEVFVALTGNSEVNLLACLIAKQFGVFKTIAKEENIDYFSVAEKFNIGTIINEKVITAGHIYRALLGQDTSTVKSLTVANADVIEVVAKRGAPIVGKPIKDLELPRGITLGGVLRNGVPFLVDGNTIIEPYDLVVAFCHDIPLRKVRKFIDS